MKKSLLILALGATVALGSCDSQKTDAPVNSNRMNRALPCALIPEDESKEVLLSAGVPFSFTRYWETDTWEIAVNGMQVPGYTPLSFTSPQLAATNSYTEDLLFRTPFSNGQGQKITDLNMILCEDYYYYPVVDTTIGSIPLGTIVTGTFRVEGEFRVCAMPNEAIYYDGAGTNAQYYKVQLNMATRQARVTLYNFNLAVGGEKVPSVVIDCAVEPDRDFGYKATGKNIRPTFQGSTPANADQYTVTEIEFEPTDYRQTRGELEITFEGGVKVEMGGTWLKRASNATIP